MRGTLVMVKQIQVGEVEERRPCSNGCAGCRCRRAEEDEAASLMTEVEQLHDRVVAALHPEPLHPEPLHHEPLERLTAEAHTVLNTEHSIWREVQR